MATIKKSALKKSTKTAKKPAKKPAAGTTKAAKGPAKASDPVKTKPKVYVAPPGPKLNDSPSYPVVNAKCRRGVDNQTVGQSCVSLTAENMTPFGSNNVRFRCTKCKYSWQVQVGGSFNL